MATTAVEETKKQALALGVGDLVFLAKLRFGLLRSFGEKWSEAEELTEAERREGESGSRQDETRNQ